MRCTIQLFLVCFVGTVVSRPQVQEDARAKSENAEPRVEVERQLIREVNPLINGESSNPPMQKEIDANTREILDKIAEVNKKQGLTPKLPKPAYFHFPFSYSRSRDEEKRDFKFSRDPFSNPVLDYVERQQTEVPKPSFRRPNVDNVDNGDGNFGVSVTDTDPDILPEDNVPGQYIKRKITHYQSYLVPNPYMANGMVPPAPQPNMPPPYYEYSSTTNNRNSELEAQTVNNIKDIVTGTQLLQNFNSEKMGKQNWNWPGASMFPIYIRDPFLQMYYAVTNMIEYGPSAGNEGPCKLTPRPQGSRVKPKIAPGSSHQVDLEISKRDNSEEIRISPSSRLSEDMQYLDVEDIDIGDEDLVRFSINLPDPTAITATGTSGARELKEKLSWGEFMNLRNHSLLTHLAIPGTQTPAIKDPVVHVDDLEEDAVEAEKADEIHVSNEGSKKVFSRDNTGNGIFIHKLKVRKGGVAIAGPGGIATAGSGGTAIVGPNGVAYTHPDGLAIAGSGTTVVAVDPKIDLNEAIRDSVLNGTRHVPNTRIGKVVAIGPVVYYNRGL